MNAIGGKRAVEGSGGGLRRSDRRHRNPTNGRQGKRPAFGAPHVVGKIEEFDNPNSTRCWRFLQIAQAFQSSERHRFDLLRDAAP
jgi:hypothetical protein